MYIVDKFSIDMLSSDSIELHIERIDFEEAHLNLLMAVSRGEAIINAVTDTLLDIDMRMLFHPSWTQGDNPRLAKGQYVNITWPMDNDSLHQLLVVQRDEEDKGQIQWWLVTAM